MRFAIATFVIFVAVACGAQDPVYVSNGPGNQVLAVWRNGTVQQVYANTRFVPEDGTVGPDGKLYFCDPTNGRIVRINPVTGTAVNVYPERANLPVLAPQGPRFEWDGDLVFTDKVSGKLYRIAGVAKTTSGFALPQELAGASPAGGGTAFSHLGTLFFASGSSVYRYNGSANQVYTFGNAVRGVARDASDNLVVADSSGVLWSCPIGATACNANPLHAFNGDYPYYLEVSADNTLWAATADAAGINGKLWSINLNTGATSSVALPKQRGSFPPAIGVAIPPSGKQLSKTIAAGSEYLFNFGANAFGLSPLLCTPGPAASSVSSTQHLETDINQRLKGTLYAGTTSLNPTVVLESGQEGFARVFHASVNGCQTDALYGVNISAFWPEPYAVNPAVARCPDDASQKCEILANFGYWVNSGFIPDDGAVSTRTKGFSDLIFVRVPFTRTEVVYSGMLSPFGPRSSDINFPTTFNVGQNITFKFQATLNNKRVTDLVALLSIEKLRPGAPTPIPVFPSGSSNDPPLFRFSSSASQYVYNLATSGWQPGLYAAHVTAINGFLPKTVYFCLNTCN